jgi:hypothetical protein
MSPRCGNEGACFLRRQARPSCWMGVSSAVRLRNSWRSASQPRQLIKRAERRLGRLVYCTASPSPRRRPQQLLDRPHDRPPGRGPVDVALGQQLVGPYGGLDRCVLAVSLHHELRGAPDVEIGDHTVIAAESPWQPITTSASAGAGSRSASRMRTERISMASGAGRSPCAARQPRAASRHSRR